LPGAVRSIGGISPRAEEIVDSRQFRIEFGVGAHFLVLVLGVCSMFWIGRCGAVSLLKGWASLLRVHQLVVKLYAQGLVKLGDPKNILEVVSRNKDKTVLLSRDEARVLSAIPDAYATNVTKIRLAVFLPEKNVQQILDRFVASRFFAAQGGFTDKTIYQITAAGLKHPQRHQDGRLAHAPRLPVESDRVHSVLSAIRDARSLRIRDLKSCTKNTSPFDKCSHAVSQEEGTSAKNQSRPSGTLFFDRKGA
jgi:hypothetical protein